MKLVCDTFPVRIARTSGLIMTDVLDHDPGPDEQTPYRIIATLREASTCPQVAMLIRSRNSHGPQQHHRRMMIDHVRGMGPQFVGASFCIPATGLRAAAYRVFATTARMIAGVPVALSNDLDQATRSLSKWMTIDEGLRAEIDAFFAG